MGLLSILHGELHRECKNASYYLVYHQEKLLLIRVIPCNSFEDG